MIRPLASFIVLGLLLVSHCLGQITSVTNSTATPVPGAGHDYIQMLNETVNPANGSLSLRIHVPVPKGRGISLPFSFDYDSNSVWHLDSFDNGGWIWLSNTSFLSQGGWSYSAPLLSAATLSKPYANGGGVCNFVSSFVFHDPTGGAHSLGLSSTDGQFGCGLNDGEILFSGDDFYRATTGTNSALPRPTSVADADGTVYYFSMSRMHQGYSPVESALADYVEDRNGNRVAVTDYMASTGEIGANRGVFAYTDTLGRTALSSSGFGSSGNTISVSGLPSSYTVNWASSNTNYSVNPVQLGTSCNPPSSLRGSQSVVASIVLPNTTSYQFVYDSTYGVLSKIIYPSGGYIRYEWGLNPQSDAGTWQSADSNGGTINCWYRYGSAAVMHRYVSFDGTNEVLRQDFSYSTTWPDPNALDWTSKQTIVTTSDFVQGKSFETDYTYVPGGCGGPDAPNIAHSFSEACPVEQTAIYKDWDGSTLRSESKAWFDVNMILSNQVTLNNGQTAKTVYSYANGNTRPLIAEIDEYDYGQGSPGPLLRKTTTNYASFPATPLFSAGAYMFSHPCQIITYDGSNARVGEQDFLYDGGTAACGTSGPASTSGVANLSGHDDANYSSGSTTPRGNVTASIAQCFFSTGQSCSQPTLSTSYSYDETGQVTSKTDPASNLTQYSYTNSFTDAIPSTNTNAYVTQITYPSTNGVSHVEKFSYAYSDGQLTQSIDQNNQATSYSYDDSLRRLKRTDYPVPFGVSTVTYTDTALAVSVETKRQIDSTHWTDAIDQFDGLGHGVAHSVANGESTPWDRVDTCYDGLGRVRFNSYPFQISNPSAGPNCSGAGDRSSYDALGRLQTTQHSDGTTIQTTYVGRATDVKDEGNGSRLVERISQVDGLGRLRALCEVTGQSQQGVPPSACSLDIAGTGFLTSYTYTAPGDLQTVTQGAVGRSFQYDSLSRLTSASNPESGTINYKYDSDSNCTDQPSYPGELISKTDALTVRTCMKYDELHRLTRKTYTDGTPAATYGYDETSKYGRPLAKTTGRKSSESTAAPNLTGEVFSYDAIGNVIDNSQCTPQNCAGNTAFAVTYPSYDNLGNVLSATNGAGVTFGYGYNSVGRLYSVTSSLVDGNHPGTLLNNIHYNSFGLPVSSSVGSLPLSDIRAYSTQRPGWGGWESSVSVSGPSTQSSGTVTVNGSEGSTQSAGATPSTGSVTISGSEQSTTVQTSAGSHSTVAIRIWGSEQSVCIRDCRQMRYDSGSVGITVNGCSTSTTYGRGSTANNIAISLIAGFSCGTVTASLNGSIITFTSVALSGSANYPFSSSYYSNDPADFGEGSFFVSPPNGNMSGGLDPVYTTYYDAGTATITVSGHGDSYGWSNGASASSIAAGLAAAIHNDGGAPADASASGNVVYLTARAAGALTYSLASSTTWDTSHFAGPAFSFSNSGSLTGGQDATYTYDNGTVTITANGTPSSTSYGQGSTNTSIASALAQAVNANNPSVMASASGNVVTLTSRSGGAYTNYSLSASSGGSLNPPSFTTSTSGSSMAGGTGATLYALGMNYYNNGDVQTANDSVNGNWNYTYDDFNRLNTAVASNINTGCAESYDRYGNRWTQQPYGGSGYGCNGFTASFGGNNNRIDPGQGYGYDAAGNMTSAPGVTYTYDAENRIIAINGGAVASYVYNAEGQRVRKTTSAGSVDFLHDLSGRTITEISSSGAWNRGEVYAGGMHLATYANDTTYFTHSDWLGTERVRSTLVGGIYSTWTSLPFGEGSNAPNPGPTHFTGKERDAESGLDNFGARYFGSTMGRFMTPDAFYKDSHVGDPQSWNEYAYARNNPLRYVDPTGENATVSTNCSTDANDHTTCNVNVSASIAIYAAPGSGLTQEQLNGAATTIQNTIQNAWSGTVQQDGVTYNVSTQVSVQVAGSEAEASKTGAQNVVGLSNGPADAVHNANALTGAGNTLGTILRGQDAGTWNYNTLGADTKAELR